MSVLVIIIRKSNEDISFGGGIKSETCHQPHGGEYYFATRRIWEWVWEGVSMMLGVGVPGVSWKAGEPELDNCRTCQSLFHAGIIANLHCVDGVTISLPPHWIMNSKPMIVLQLWETQWGNVEIHTIWQNPAQVSEEQSYPDTKGGRTSSVYNTSLRSWLLSVSHQLNTSNGVLKQYQSPATKNGAWSRWDPVATWGLHLRKNAETFEMVLR